MAFFPALRLAKGIDLGEWRVSGDVNGVPWRNDRFKELVQKLMSTFDAAEFPDGAMVFHREKGFNGEVPSEDLARNLEAAIRFAMLDANDHVIDLANAGRHLTTSENAALYIQPIDEDLGTITHREGGLLRPVLVGGCEIGSSAPPLPDATVALDQRARISQTLTRATFDALQRPDIEQNRRLGIAIEWHSFALTNPRAVTLPQRIVALKTGFEALLRKSDSRQCAKKLRKLFERVTRDYGNLLPWTGVLWSPNERKDLARSWRKRDGSIERDTRTELEDWFMALADARNEIIHEGRLTSAVYAPPPERPLSRYAGHLFWKGERVLREAIKATLGAEVLLCGKLTAHRRYQALFDAHVIEQLLEQQGLTEGEDDEREDDEPTTSNALPPARSVEELLVALQCPTANHVTLRKRVGASSPSLAMAEKNAREAENQWIAIAGGIQLLIYTHESDALRSAGAELELPRRFEPCD